MATKVIKIENLDKALAKSLSELTETSRREVARIVQDLPQKFEREAKVTYTNVLRVRSGQLRGAIQPISRRTSDNSWEIGLRNDKNYALIQHEGGTIPPHVIRPRNAKALFWPGARHPVKKVNHPGGFIKATKFLEDPILRVMAKAKELILSKIKWKA